MKSIIKLSFLSAVLFSMMSFVTYSSIGDWEMLGKRKVNYSLDKDVIKVTARDGAFRKLKFQVKGGALNMHKVIVQYGNGEKDVINVKHNFSRRSGTRIIDLEGNKRIIRDITFFYDTKNNSRRRASIIVFGKH